MKKNLLILGVLVGTIVIGGWMWTTRSLERNGNLSEMPNNEPISPSPSPTLGPSATLVESYVVPEIEADESYTIIMVGDSMTVALGREPQILRDYLEASYPDKVFGIFNVAQASTNMRTMPELLHEPFVIEGKEVEPILDRYFDVIIIESFGYNPLSDLGLEEGLQQQEEILDTVVTDIIETHPDSVIVFLATVAPNSERYGLQSLDLSNEVRRQWVEERRAYIENHIRYAQEHNIPLINVYEETQSESGDGSLRYINPDDYIHPSAEAVDLINRRIAEFLVQREILPR